MAGRVFREIEARQKARPWWNKFIAKTKIRIKVWRLLYFKLMANIGNLGQSGGGADRVIGYKDLKQPTK